MLLHAVYRPAKIQTNNDLYDGFAGFSPSEQQVVHNSPSRATNFEWIWDGLGDWFGLSFEIPLVYKSDGSLQLLGAVSCLACLYQAMDVRVRISWLCSCNPKHIHVPRRVRVPKRCSCTQSRFVQETHANNRNWRKPGNHERRRDDDDGDGTTTTATAATWLRWQSWTHSVINIYISNAVSPNHEQKSCWQWKGRSVCTKTNNK